jgi:translation initiation factor IF-3
MSAERGAVKGRPTGPRINRQITAQRVRLTLDDGTQVGVVPFWEAYNRAQEMGLDLVEVSAHSNPPVCKIMDFGRHKFEESKKRKNQGKNSRNTEAKEVQLRPVTGDHDLETKMSAARRFLDEGRIVQVTVVFRNREMHFREHGVDIINRMIDGLKDVSQPDRPAAFNDRRLSVRLMPTKKD